MEDGSERPDDDMEVIENRYDPVGRDALPALTPLTVVLPEQWGDTTAIHYGVSPDGSGYTAQAEFPSGGIVGLWARPSLGQPDEPIVLCDDAGLRVTWSPELLRAVVCVADTSVFVSGDGVEVERFESVLRSLRVVER